MAEQNQAPEIVIIGGGIIGCAVAWEFAREGVPVQVIERREIAREASWASAGIISPPSPRHLSRADLALRSYRQYPALIDEVESISGISVGYVPSGELDLGTDETEDTLRATMDWQSQHGMSVEWLDSRALREREPALHEQFTCALYAAEAGSLILDRMTHALARAATTRGATIAEHTPVLDIVIQGGRATGVRTLDRVVPVGAVVITAGAWSRIFSDSLDFPLPTIPVKGQMMSISDPPIRLKSVISGCGGYLVPRADGTIAIGATEEHDAGFDTSVTPGGVAWLTGLLACVAPTLVHARLAATWAGLRPATEDGEMIVGRLPHLDNVWVATGHFRSGALLAPATAAALAASMSSGKLDPILASFDPARLI